MQADRPLPDPAALEAACKFIEQKIAPRRCDSDGVSDCWRCKSVYLAKRVRELIASPAPADEPLKERCEHGIRWENRCSACDAPRLHSLIERQLPTATFFRFDGDGQFGGWTECRADEKGAVPMFTKHDIECIVAALAKSTGAPN